jgi:hypothetical protein
MCSRLEIRYSDTTFCRALQGNEVVIVGDYSWQIIAVWFKKLGIDLHNEVNTWANGRSDCAVWFKNAS